MILLNVIDSLLLSDCKLTDFLHINTQLHSPGSPTHEQIYRFRADIIDDFVKSRHEDHRWLDKKVDIRGVVFLAGSRLYTWYVESLLKTYNEGDRAFYDAIIIGVRPLLWKPSCIRCPDLQGQQAVPP